MNFTAAPNPPVIMFVGRPGDSRKGLTTLLDALEILARFPDVPPFITWIVGGSLSEMAGVNEQVCLRPILHGFLETGRLVVWGRVKNDALPELYSRATVLAIPSTREEFGIVAIEAMMCGLPVVASRCGGLRDLVLNGKTGILVQPDEPRELAAALAPFVRNPRIAQQLGAFAERWARSSFATESTYQTFLDLYQGEDAHRRSSAHPLSQGDLKMGLQSEAHSRMVRKLLGGNLDSCSLIRNHRHSCFDVSIRGVRHFAKVFADVASWTAGLFPGWGRRSIGLRTGGDLLRRTLYYDGNSVSPAVIMYGDDSCPVVVFRWYEAYPSLPPEEADAFVVHTARCYRTFACLTDDADLREYISSLEKIAAGESEDNYLKFDQAGAALNRRLDGLDGYFRRTHPQVELRRLARGITAGIWPLPVWASSKILPVVKRFGYQEPIVIRMPTLAHADIKPEHLLRGPNGPIVCDPEHSVYAVGALDEAFWIFHVCFASVEKPTPEIAIRRLAAMVPDPCDFRLAVYWLLANTVFDMLLRLTKGNNRVLDKAASFVADFDKVKDIETLAT